MTIQAKYTTSKGLVQTGASGFATATLSTTTPITLTSTIKGDSRNKSTFQLDTLAQADNAGQAVLVAFTGTRDAIVCTVTPDDAPTTLTTAELVELINTGAVVGKDVTITAGDHLRTLQTASGGGAENLANGGEGDKSGTFLGAPTSEFHVSGVGISSDLETVKAGEFVITCVASVAGSLQGKSFSLDSGNGTIKFVMQAGGADVSAGNTNINLGNAARDVGDVASDVAGVINGLAGFSAAADGNDVVVKNAKTGLTDQAGLGAGTSGFTIAVTSEGAGKAGGILNTTGVTIIGHNHGGAATMTLGDLTENQAGTIKLIKQLHGGNGTFDVSITSHTTSDPEVARFDANTEQLSLIWLGSQWTDLIAKGGADSNTATNPA